MESKARERVEAAEIESYRLKGRESIAVVTIVQLCLRSIQFESP
jgi:hypothetical protein